MNFSPENFSRLERELATLWPMLRAEREANAELKRKIEELEKDAAHVRMLLAVRVAPLPQLYTDDGELQDNSASQFIDFKRDPAGVIEAKLRHRALKQEKD
jgi:hypothetical protein